VVLVAAVVLALTGAAGLLPKAFTGSLAFWTSETQGRVDVHNARRVAQGPGPDGTVLSVWSARSADGTTCIAPMFEAPGPLDRPAPADFQPAGGQCHPTVPAEPFGNLGASSDERGIFTVWVTAGDAARADVVFADGTARAALPAQGMFFLWYATGPLDRAPVLLGYDAAGRVVGEIPLPG
jgi:hypothetical protein